MRDESASGSSIITPLLVTTSSHKANEEPKSGARPICPATNRIPGAASSLGGIVNCLGLDPLAL